MENTSQKLKHLWLLAGIPGSGKDTYLQEAGISNEIIVSRDRIRFLMLDRGDQYFSKEKEVFNCFIKGIQDALDMYDICYANATHLNEKSRLKVLNLLNLSNVSVHAIYVNTDYETCIERNNKRLGLAKVPEEVINNMHMNLTHPKDDKHIKYKSIIEVNNDLCN